MVSGRISKGILVITLFALLGLIAAFSVNSPFDALASSADYDMVVNKMMPGIYTSEAAGTPLEIDCHPKTTALKIKLDAGNDVYTIDNPELEYNPDSGRLEGYLIAHFNGDYYFLAIVTDNEEEIELEPIIVTVTEVDYLAPFANEKNDIYTFEGSRLVSFSTMFDDYNHIGKSQKQTSYSGISDIIVFCDPDERAPKDWGLGDRVLPEDVLNEESFVIIDKWLNQSPKSPENFLYVEFSTQTEGAYYYYSRDNVGNTNIERLFVISPKTQYLVIVDGREVDVSGSISLANDCINTTDVYGSAILEELRIALSEFMKNIHIKADEDVISTSYYEFRNALIAVTGAKDAKFSINVNNKYLIDWDIRLTDFNSSTILGLKGENVVCDISLLEYRPEHAIFNTITNDVTVKSANKIIVLQYKLLKDGILTTPKSSFKFDLAIPKTYKRAAVAIYDGTRYNVIEYEKGKEWLIFSTASGSEDFYLIVYDSSLGLPELLWLYISLSVVGLAGLVTAIVFYFKKSAKKKQSEKMEKTEDIKEENKESISASQNKSKKGNKSKKKKK